MLVPKDWYSDGPDNVSDRRGEASPQVRGAFLDAFLSRCGKEICVDCLWPSSYYYRWIQQSTRRYRLNIEPSLGGRSWLHE